MKLLIDECLPRALKAHFVGHDCQTVRDMYEQNLVGRRIAVLLLLAPSNKLEDLLPIISRSLGDLGTIKRGTVRRVS